MDYMTAKEAAEKWAITPRRVQVLCAQGKIPGAIRFGVTWAIPKDTAKPKDGRFKTTKSD
ncbi:helix-turn-helix domain-containing protein [Sinanaerobacter sp. ZZT-01]|uniref:helix-turn-helix domain-containing protein n=1 Tax=Sinanaerobacter sp. ZZT-01 TaxID=3111540 RepID=UPI002D792EE0|nr:helix-turn-helix domain-containing protein [Sinanaerobacter sp. ZZT-01]WRR93859.1 helix-turn-helix domain-containing protein [Sinanaerobacter sp. ZZT-01]